MFLANLLERFGWIHRPFAAAEVGAPFHHARAPEPEDDGRWHLDQSSGIYHKVEGNKVRVWGPEAVAVGVHEFPRLVRVK